MTSGVNCNFAQHKFMKTFTVSNILL